MKIAWLAIAALAASCLAANAKDAVTWHPTEFPPFYILNGEFAHTGISDRHLKYFLDRLTDFDNSLVPTPLARAWGEIEAGQNVCVLGVKNPERERIALFSKPLIVGTGMHLLVSTSRVAAFKAFEDATGAVDLDRLVQDRMLKGAYAAARSFGSLVDRAIAEGKETGALKPLQVTPQALRMVDSGRADYTFGFGPELVYMKMSEKRPINIQALRIAGEPRIAYQYFACARTETGKAVIAAIDDLIARTDGLQSTLIQAVRTWYSDEDLADFEAASGR